MRPCGGFTPDMIDFAHNTDVYKIGRIWWHLTALPCPWRERILRFAGRRDGKDFVMSHKDILDKYGSHIKMVNRIPDVLAEAMGNQMYVAVFDSQRELDAFYQDILRCNE